MTISGITQSVKRGHVVFIAAGQKLDFVSTENHEILMFRAYCEI